MEIEIVNQLLDLMEKHGLDEIEVEHEGTRVRLRKGNPAPITTPILAAPFIHHSNGAPPAPVAPAAASNSTTAAKDEGIVEVKSPMVGTFYRSSSRDTDPFVSDGDLVTADSVVCIIEAMKVMNEIKAEADGEVVKFLIEDGESVEFGQTLLAIRNVKPQ